MRSLHDQIRDGVRAVFGAHLETAGIDAAARAIRRGDFDAQIEAIVVDTVRSGPDTGLTRLGFILKMAVEAMDRSTPRLTFSQAKDIANRTYVAFRRDNAGVKFGDPDFDWSGRAAVSLIREYEIDYWEPV